LERGVAATRLGRQAAAERRAAAEEEGRHELVLARAAIDRHPERGARVLVAAQHLEGLAAGDVRVAGHPARHLLARGVLQGGDRVVGRLERLAPLRREGEPAREGDLLLERFGEALAPIARKGAEGL